MLASLRRQLLQPTLERKGLLPQSPRSAVFCGQAQALLLALEHAPSQQAAAEFRSMGLAQRVMRAPCLSCPCSYAGLCASSQACMVCRWTIEQRIRALIAAGRWEDVGRLAMEQAAAAKAADRQ